MDNYAFSPGPLDDSVLYDQDKHVSEAIWAGQERGALRCHEHTSKLDRWILTDKQIELVKKAGFGCLRLIPAISLDNPLISALVERWRKETNTFHFRVGEMTVTLEDVAYLLGLSIDGEPVIGTTYTACDQVCVMYLGRGPDSGFTSGGMVKLSWLKETFSHCPENASTEVIEQHTRAYLLYLVGSTIFSTTTGNKVPVMYLPLFENFNNAGKYAWGAAALAFLYRALGSASIRTQSTISGCLTLLQCWSYYHLNVGRPRLNHDPIHECFPFVLRWKGKQSGPTSNRDVVFYRKAFDNLEPTDVVWCPYTNISKTVVPASIDYTIKLGIGRSKTMLLCFDKAERHLPDRCMRQFGMNQQIPDPVEKWERKSRGVDGGVNLSAKMESELHEWACRRLNIVVGDDDMDETEYMEWYSKITRILVGRPIPISSEFERMSEALRIIYSIAHSINLQGMDAEQAQNVMEIQNVAQEGLSGQMAQPDNMAAVMPPVPVPVKRGRGKEKVRRKSVGKRRKKEADSDSSPSSPVHLLHFNAEDESQTMARMRYRETDDSQASLADVKADDDEDVDVCEPIAVDDSHFRPPAEETEENEASQDTPEDLPHTATEATEVVQQSSLENSEDVARQVEAH